MIFVATPLPDVWIVEPEFRRDQRGFFARVHCDVEFRARGIAGPFVQTSLSYNRTRGTLRGLHWQGAPHGEAKLVRCTSGAIYDVALDLRADSPSYRRWHAVELSADNRRAMYVPVGFAHGFQTLTDGAEVIYQISTAHAPGSARGVRWDDPAFDIRWPACEARILSRRDASYPDYDG